MVSKLSAKLGFVFILAAVGVSASFRPNGTIVPSCGSDVDLSRSSIGDEGHARQFRAVSKLLFLVDEKDRTRVDDGIDTQQVVEKEANLAS